MISIFLVVHVLLSLSIIGLIMLQRGKGADAGASLGGGSSGAVFGARGAANFLSRTTAVLAAAFFVTSLSLAYLSSGQQTASSVETGSVLDQPVELPADTDIPAADGDIPAAAMPADSSSDMPMAEEVEAAPASDIPASE